MTLRRPAVRPRAALHGALALFAALFPGSVRAEPIVRVRADSRIELGVTHLDVGMSITGALRDELGHGLADRPLALSAIPLDDPDAPFDTTVRTNAGGEFSLEIADGNHDYRLLASFEGDAGHRGVRVERSVERARSDVRLELRVAAGSRLDLDAPKVSLTAIAESDAGGSGIALRLSDETGKELALSYTDARGHAHFDVPTALFGPPGTGLLRVESLRDERHAEAQTEARIIRSRKIAVALRSERARVEMGNELDVQGTVSTAAGPCPELPVGLFIGKEHVRTVMTEADGTFAARLSIDSPPENTSVSARVEADPAGAHPHAEDTKPLAIVAPEPLPLTWLLGLPLGLLTTLGLARLRRAHKLARRAHEASGTSGGDPLRERAGQPSFEIAGIVLGGEAPTPIAGARIELTHTSAEASLVLCSDTGGRFRSGSLPQGGVRVRVSADGWVATHVDVTLPHRGEGAELSIRLESLRLRAVRAFRAAVEGRLPFPRAFGVWTTREVRAFLAQRRPEQRIALGELSLDVERATYAAEPPSERDVAQIEQRAGRLTATESEPVRTTGTESAASGKKTDQQRPSAR